MSDEQARALAIRINMFYANHDPWSFADTLADFDNNEELLLEQTFKDLQENPDVIIDHLLEILENWEG